MISFKVHGVLILLILDRRLLMLCEVCDMEKFDNLPEGNIGESAAFPWLGILRVHIHEGKKLKVALTGVALIKVNYVVANADDIVRIPKSVFTEDSKAMFLPRAGEPWYCALVDYLTHPEYGFSTKNTIALVELKLLTTDKMSVKPACWPSYSFNASNQLYVAGYTDENKLLEKFLYKLQYVPKENCEQFYERAEKIERMSAPIEYQCGYAENAEQECVWDNAMAMVSNSTGSWTLIGVGLQGPGCAAPARFIDITPYLSWIESATDMELVNDYEQSAFSLGFRRSFGNQPEGYQNQTENADLWTVNAIKNDTINQYHSNLTSP